MGTTGYRINWIIGDYHPDTYQLYVNSDLVDSGTWINGTIIWDVDSYTSGIYQVTLIVLDSAQHNATDTVSVTVATAAAPILSTPADLTYEEGTTGHLLNWEVGDRSPDTYTIYMNSNQVETGTWTNGTLSWNVDNFASGTYNMTIEVWDAAQHHVFDTVWVTVTTPTTPPISELPISSTLVLLSLVAFVYLNLRRKKC